MTKSWNHWLGWTIAAVVAADWFSKFWIQNQLVLYETVALIDGWLHLVNVQNNGIAFGLLNENAAVWRLPLLVTLVLVALFALGRIARSVTDTRTRFAVALIMGGALGNLGDRIVNGAVTDFISLPFFPYVFNIADVAVTIGGTLLVLGLSRKEAGEVA